MPGNKKKKRYGIERGGTKSRKGCFGGRPYQPTEEQRVQQRKIDEEKRQRRVSRCVAS